MPHALRAPVADVGPEEAPVLTDAVGQVGQIGQVGQANQAAESVEPAPEASSERQQPLPRPQVADATLGPSVTGRVVNRTPAELPERGPSPAPSPVPDPQMGPEPEPGPAPAPAMSMDEAREALPVTPEEPIQAAQPIQESAATQDKPHEKRMPIIEQTFDEAMNRLVQLEEEVVQSAGEGGELGRDITENVETARRERAARNMQGRMVDRMQQANEAQQAGEVAPDDGQAQPEGEGVAEPAVDPELLRDDMLLAAQADIMNGEFEPAMAKLDQLLADPDLSDAMREEVLYNRAEALYKMHRDDLSSHFGEVAQAFDRAVNFNPESVRVPGALLQLGLLNLHVDNLPEARAYFNVLKKKYPNDLNIPYISFYWGEYWFNKGRYQKAADEYQFLIQEYPDSTVVLDASVGLARSLERLGYHEQAWDVVDFVDKRWPRFYVETPTFLRLSGDVAYSLDNLQQAGDDYWTYYNLMPEAEDNDIVLARLGDIYLRTDRTQAAREMYESVAARFPDEEGGLVARMRLAEEGIYDEPSVDEMFTVFDRPFNQRPEEIYSQIVSDYPQSPIAPLAQLKLAMWRLFHKKDVAALESATEFLELYPRSELGERAREVARLAFGELVNRMSAEQNWGRIVEVWDRFPLIREQQDILSPQTRMAVAGAMYQAGLPRRALAVSAPFREGDKQGEVSEQALTLAMSVFLDDKRYGDIVQMAENVKGWDLPPRLRRQVDYGEALGLTNIGQLSEARPLWARLSGDSALPPEQRAVALYYVAETARERGDWEQQYVAASEALSLLLQTGQDVPRIQRTLQMLTNVTERTGRLVEALRWAREYDRYFSPDDEGWPGSRFKLAELHRQLGEPQRWRELLEEIVEKRPESLFGRTAASALQAEELQERARNFGQTALN